MIIFRSQGAVFSHRFSPHQQLGVNFSRVIKAFIIFRDEPGGPSAYFDKLSDFTNIFGSAVYITQTLLGDGFVVSYRSAQFRYARIQCEV